MYTTERLIRKINAELERLQLDTEGFGAGRPEISRPARTVQKIVMMTEHIVFTGSAGDVLDVLRNVPTPDCQIDAYGDHVGFVAMVEALQASPFVIEVQAG